MKALATATCSLRVRVIEDEFTLDLIVNEVHLCADYEEESFLVYDYPDASLLNDFVKLANLILLYIVHNIGVAVATTPPHIYLHSISLFIFHQFVDPICCLLGLNI